MDKLTRQQEDVICELLHHSHSEEVTQYILERIGRKNWTRDILSESVLYLTEEQDELYESLGRGFDEDDITAEVIDQTVNEEIASRLKTQGITKYLYENIDYLDAIRIGEIICEGIDVEQIKNSIVME